MKKAVYNSKRERTKKEKTGGENQEGNFRKKILGRKFQEESFREKISGRELQRG